MALFLSGFVGLAAMATNGTAATGSILVAWGLAFGALSLTFTATKYVFEYFVARTQNESVSQEDRRAAPAFALLSVAALTSVSVFHDEIKALNPDKTTIAGEESLGEMDIASIYVPSGDSIDTQTLLIASAIVAGFIIAACGVYALATKSGFFNSYNNAAGNDELGTELKTVFKLASTTP